MTKHRIIFDSYFIVFYLRSQKIGYKYYKHEDGTLKTGYLGDYVKHIPHNIIVADGSGHCLERGSTGAFVECGKKEVRFEMGQRNMQTWSVDGVINYIDISAIAIDSGMTKQTSIIDEIRRVYAGANIMAKEGNLNF